MPKPPTKLISNKFRCSSLSELSISIEANEKLGVGTDPLEILIEIEELEGEVREEAIFRFFTGD